MPTRTRLWTKPSTAASPVLWVSPRAMRRPRAHRPLRSKPAERSGGPPRTGGLSLCGRRPMLGLLLNALLRTHQIEEAREQVVAVVRAGRRFGVILHRKDRPAVDAEPGIGSIEQ